MRIGRYFLVGAVSAAVDFGVYSLLVLIVSAHYLLAGALGFVIATAVNYRLSVRYVFDAGIAFTPTCEVVAVFGVSAIGLLIHQTVLFLSVDLLGMHLLLGKICATGSTFFWNYLGRSRFVFAPRS